MRQANKIKMAKVMEYPNGTNGDAHMGFWSGLVVGLLKLFDIYLLTDIYIVVLIKVLLTAVVGGLGGVAGKQLFFYLKKLYDKRFNKNKRP